MEPPRSNLTSIGLVARQRLHSSLIEQEIQKSCERHQGLLSIGIRSVHGIENVTVSLDRARILTECFRRFERNSLIQTGRIALRPCDQLLLSTIEPVAERLRFSSVPRTPQYCFVGRESIGAYDQSDQAWRVVAGENCKRCSAVRARAGIAWMNERCEWDDPFVRFGGRRRSQSHLAPCAIRIASAISTEQSLEAGLESFGPTVRITSL